MTGLFLEHLKQREVREGDYLVRREYLDNGIRVVTLEFLNIANDIGDRVTLEEFSEKEPVLKTCLDSLKNSLENSEGEISDEIRSAVLETGRCLNSYVRGICGINREQRELPQDGIVYISLPALKLGRDEDIQKQMNIIMDQLKKYSE